MIFFFSTVGCVFVPWIVDFTNQLLDAWNWENEKSIPSEVMFFRCSATICFAVLLEAISAQDCRSSALSESRGFLGRDAMFAGCVFQRCFLFKHAGVCTFFLGGGHVSSRCTKKPRMEHGKGKKHLQITNLLCVSISILPYKRTILHAYYIMYFKTYFLTSEESLRKFKYTMFRYPDQFISGLSKIPCFWLLRAWFYTALASSARGANIGCAWVLVKAYTRPITASSPMKKGPKSKRKKSPNHHF